MKKSIGTTLCHWHGAGIVEDANVGTPSCFARQTSPKAPLETGRATDLVELLYALDTCNCISNGEIGVEELADTLSEIFGVEIKNCYNVYMNMKRRKDDSRTYFLGELREKLNKRMVGSDLKGGKFKKQ